MIIFVVICKTAELNERSAASNNKLDEVKKEASPVLMDSQLSWTLLTLKASKFTKISLRRQVCAGFNSVGGNWGWVGCCSGSADCPGRAAASCLRRTSAPGGGGSGHDVVIGVGVGVVPPERRPPRRPLFLLLPGREPRGWRERWRTAEMRMPVVGH